MKCWSIWAAHNTREGLTNAYSRHSTTDYLPLYQYVLWAFGRLLDTPQVIADYIGYTRIVNLLVEFWALYLVYRWIDRNVEFHLLLTIAMLNLAYSYNTLMWGQIDAIFSGLAFAAFYYLYRSKTVLSALMMLLALNVRLQAIIFVPLWGILLLATLHREKQWRKAFSILGVMVGL